MANMNIRYLLQNKSCFLCTLSPGRWNTKRRFSSQPRPHWSVFHSGFFVSSFLYLPQIYFHSKSFNLIAEMFWVHKGQFDNIWPNPNSKVKGFDQLSSSTIVLTGGLGHEFNVKEYSNLTGQVFVWVFEFLLRYESSTLMLYKELSE